MFCYHIRNDRKLGNAYEKMKLVLFILIVLFTSGCSEKLGSQPENFFVPIDSYYATGKETDHGITLTYVFKNGYAEFKENKVASIQFADIFQNVIVKDFHITKEKYAHGADYEFYAISLDFEFNKLGLYQTHEIVIRLDDSAEHIYPIGNWVFDVGEQQAEPPAINTWESPMVSSNGTRFAYAYKLEADDAKITTLWYGQDQKLHDPDGVPLSGNIPLENSEAPIRFIQTKMEVLHPDGTTETVYGKGCYCGAIDSPEDVFTASREYRLRSSR